MARARTKAGLGRDNAPALRFAKLTHLAVDERRAGQEDRPARLLSRESRAASTPDRPLSAPRFRRSREQSHAPCLARPAGLCGRVGQRGSASGPSVPAGRARSRRPPGCAATLASRGSAARELIAKHSLTFPIGYSADAAAIHQATGAFVNADPVYLQSTGSVLDPDGNVIVSVYSSGAIGRLVPEDVTGLVSYVKSKQPA